MHKCLQVLKSDVPHRNHETSMALQGKKIPFTSHAMKTRSAPAWSSRRPVGEGTCGGRCPSWEPGGLCSSVWLCPVCVTWDSSSVPQLHFVTDLTQETCPLQGVYVCIIVFKSAALFTLYYICRPSITVFLFLDFLFHLLI